MKKIVASVGLVALGASGLQSTSAQVLASPDTSKPWSVSLTLRGFYDDNTSTLPNAADVKDRGSFGWEVSPSAAVAWSLERTTISVGVLYSLKYYQDKPPLTANHEDQVFTFNGSVSHSFTESLRGRVSDSFVIGQEPDLLRAGNTFSTFQRVSGDNIRNYGSISLDDQITPTFGAAAGYDNAFYDYKSHEIGLIPDPRSFGLSDIFPSLAGSLNRIEHRAHVEGTYLLQPQTKLLLGYQFTEIDYTADELIGGFTSFFFPGQVFYPAFSDQRNSREHTVYVGAEHNFLPELTGSVRAGGSFTDYYNDPSSSSSVTPYVNATLKYTYMPESYVQGGFSYDRNATDLVGLFEAGKFTLDAESAVLYASVNHRIDPRLFVTLLGQFQNSTYNGGVYNSQAEQYYLLGLDLEYKFNAFFSGHVGYNYDRLESPSEIGRTYDRNRVYIGVTASY